MGQAFDLPTIVKTTYETVVRLDADANYAKAERDRLRAEIQDLRMKVNGRSEKVRANIALIVSSAAVIGTVLRELLM